MYDVIVIGSGPAGCMTAKKLAESGYNVLLAEKMELPREKSCSGILIPKSIRMVEKEFGIIPNTIFSRPKINRGIILTNEVGRVFKFENEGYNIWRNLFDHWMALKAENAGVKLKPSTTALSCEEQYEYVNVKFKDKKEKTRMVIACDGANSTIRRNLTKTSPNYIITYQTFSQGTINLDSQFFHAFLDPQLSQYDAWFNVKDNHLIIGVGVKETPLMKNYHSKFVSFLKSHYNARIGSYEKVELGIIPHITSDFQLNLGIGRVLFAGDAANLLNPMGEGISSALPSGYAAAEAVKSDSNPDDILNIYKSNVQKEIEYMKRQWKFLSNISSKFGHFPA